jgi:hypothetical protein
MGGGTAAHDRIANAECVELTVRLRLGRCGSPGPDMKRQTGTGDCRPDALIDCGLCVSGAIQAPESVAVFEALSRRFA